MSERKIVRPTLTDEQLMDLCTQYIIQFRDKHWIIRQLMSFELGQGAAFNLYNKALTAVTSINRAINDELRSVYIQSLAEYKSRCMKAGDLTNEWRALREIGLALQTTDPNPLNDNDAVDPEIKAKLIEAFQKLKKDE